MPHRRLPVVPHLDQLKHQAKDLLRAMHAGDHDAIAEFTEFHPDPPDPANAKLADAQLVLARSYYASSWTRLVQAVELVKAIWADDINTVRGLVTANPHLIHQEALIRKDSNWGPPMTYAANVGRDEIIVMLDRMGAKDHRSAVGRALLQGKTTTARMLHKMLGSPVPPDGALGGSAYTLNVEGTAAVFEFGYERMYDDDGRLLAPVETVLQTDSRKPDAKHRILEMYVERGVQLPDTPVFALHRGRIDLLEEHLHRDPSMLSRTWRHRDIYPEEMLCGDPIDATVGTPLDGTTLLHMAIEYDEMEIAQWLIAKGADVNARARTGKSGFGGYTPLFNTVVSQPNFWMNYHKRGPFVAPFTELLLQHGADPNVRASIWKRLHPGHGDTTRHDYRDVTALSWGRRFHDPIFVSEPAMRLIEAAGGVE
ncbi:MAG TPA: ankyrin repeat domain-containing protein [Gemmatimonadaceae bacterium]|nr:ankyrin repeat domain-containing protein [Gemmatimonadaceae bacterium]